MDTIQRIKAINDLKADKALEHRRETQSDLSAIAVHQLHLTLL